jgi:hypothetical protein
MNLSIPYRKGTRYTDCPFDGVSAAGYGSLEDSVATGTSRSLGRRSELLIERGARAHDERVETTPFSRIPLCGVDLRVTHE